MKKILFVINLILIFFVLIATTSSAQNKRDHSLELKKTSEKHLLGKFNSEYDLNDDVTVIIRFSNPPLATAYEGWKKWTGDNYIKALYAIEREHNTFMSNLIAIEENSLSLNKDLLPSGSTILHDYKIVLNGMAIKTKYWLVKEIAMIDNIISISPDRKKFKNDDDSNEIIGADDIWSDYSITGEGVVIAIIDTGIDPTHEAFSGNTFVPGYDFVNNDSNTYDDDGHGTHCAGIAAANGGTTIRGVAYGADLMAVKVLDDEGSGWDSDIIEGIEFAVDPDEDPNTDDGANIISLSLGGTGNPDDDLSESVDNSVLAGVFCAVAAGNEGPNANTIGSPGCSRECMCVANTTKSDLLNSGSSRGPTDAPRILKPDIAAPGTNILSSVPGNDYESWTGTSMATPHIAGAAALMMEQFPDMTAKEIKAVLCQSSDDLGYDPFDQGHGRADLNGAFNLEQIITPPTKDLLNDGNLSDWEGVATFQIKNFSDATEEYDFSFTDIDFPGAFSTTVSPDNATVGAGNTQDFTIYFDFDSDATGYYFGKATATTSSQTVHSLIFLNASGNGSGGCLTEYEFSDGSVSYNEISSSGEVLYNGSQNNDDGYWENTDIGFDFSLCGQNFSEMTVYVNGYITLGDGYNLQYDGPIYNEVNKCISPLGQDLYARQTNSEIRVLTTGSSPNRVCTIQYKNLKQYDKLNTTNYNFQIKLYETSNTIEFVYGSFTYTAAGYEIYDVGFTGDISSASSDYYNRLVDSGLNTWATSETGTSIEDYCEIATGFIPSSGLYYRWTPDSEETLDPPTLVSPANNATGIPLDVTLDWDDVNGATSYTVQVALSDSFSSYVVNQTIGNSQYEASDLNTNTQYYWRVKATNDDTESAWSSVWNFTTEESSGNDCPWTFTSETGNNATIIVQIIIEPTIGGRGFADGDAIGAFFTDGDDEICAGFAVWDGNNLAFSVWADDPYTDDKDGFANNEPYILKAWDAVNGVTLDAIFTVTSGPTSYSSDAITMLASFSTQLSPPTPTSPEDNSTDVSTSPTLEWTEISTSDTYHLKVSTDSDFGSTIIDDNTLTTESYNLEDLGYLTEYFWRLKSLTSEDESEWSEVFSFTTEAAPVPWEVITQTGGNAQIIVQTSIDPQIGERDFANGDAIGAFFINDNSQLACAGYAVWNGGNMGITVWADDQYTDEKDGYANSETYQFKAWDGHTGEEYNAQFTISAGPSAYIDDGMTYLGSFAGVNEITQTLILSDGWHIISAYVEPENIDVEVIMQAIEDNLLIMKNGAGDIYMPSLSINGINEWNILDGYKVYLTSEETLEITGLLIDPALTTYELSSGWHLISYIRNSSNDIETALSDIASNLLICKNGAGDIYMPSLSINNINQMNPGEGYQLYLTSYDELTYPANASPRKAYTGDRLLTTRADKITPQFSNTGSNMTLIIEAGNIPERSEIAILTGDKSVVGSGAVHNGSAAITIWGDNDITQEKDGAALFENLSAELLNSKTKDLSELPLNNFLDMLDNSKSNNLQYYPNSVIMALSSVEVVGITNKLELSVIPNPITSTSSIEYVIPEDGLVSLKLYSATGELIQVILNQNQNAGKYRLDFDSAKLQSGVYNLQLNTNMFRRDMMIVVIK